MSVFKSKSNILNHTAKMKEFVEIFFFFNLMKISIVIGSLEVVTANPRLKTRVVSSVDAKLNI